MITTRRASGGSGVLHPRGERLAIARSYETTLNSSYVQVTLHFLSLSAAAVPALSDFPSAGDDPASFVKALSPSLELGVPFDAVQLRSIITALLLDAGITVDDDIMGQAIDELLDTPCIPIESSEPRGKSLRTLLANFILSATLVIGVPVPETGSAWIVVSTAGVVVGHAVVGAAEGIEDAVRYKVETALGVPSNATLHSSGTRKSPSTPSAISKKSSQKVVSKRSSDAKQSAVKKSSEKA